MAIFSHQCGSSHSLYGFSCGMLVLYHRERDSCVVLIRSADNLLCRTCTSLKYLNHCHHQTVAGTKHSSMYPFCVRALACRVSPKVLWVLLHACFSMCAKRMRWIQALVKWEHTTCLSWSNTAGTCAAAVAAGCTTDPLLQACRMRLNVTRNAGVHITQTATVLQVCCCCESLLFASIGHCYTNCINIANTKALHSVFHSTFHLFL